MGLAVCKVRRSEATLERLADLVHPGASKLYVLQAWSRQNGPKGLNPTIPGAGWHPEIDETYTVSIFGSGSTWVTKTSESPERMPASTSQSSSQDFIIHIKLLSELKQR